MSSNLALPLYKLSVFVHPSNFDCKQISQAHLQSHLISPPMDSQNHNQKPSTHHAHKVSPGDLLSSAKVVADAVESSLRHEGSKVDKGRVADAAADLLCAASHYGKLEEKSYGKYVEKAETYLHKYNSSHSSGHSAAAAHSSSTHSTATGAGTHSDGGSFGEYMKMAEGFLKKH